MKKNILIMALFLTFIFLFSCSTNRSAIAKETTYVPVDTALYNTLLYQDSVFFNAFNTRNLENLKTFLETDLEVFQDNTGVRSYEQTVEAFKGLFEKDYILTRQLIKSSLEVYPIKDYGAIETGKHTFCHIENGKLECATYKFVQIWQKQNGQWKISKIITYGH